MINIQKGWKLFNVNFLQWTDQSLWLEFKCSEVFHVQSIFCDRVIDCWTNWCSYPLQEFWFTSSREHHLLLTFPIIAKGKGLTASCTDYAGQGWRSHGQGPLGLHQGEPAANPREQAVLHSGRWPRFLERRRLRYLAWSNIHRIISSSRFMYKPHVYCNLWKKGGESW